MGTISFKHTARVCVCVCMYTQFCSSMIYHYCYFSSHSLEALLNGDGCIWLVIGEAMEINELQIE